MRRFLQPVYPAPFLQEAEFHVTQEETDIYPDFVTIARGFGVPSKRVRHPSELRAAIREMLDTPGPFLLDVMVQTILLKIVLDACGCTAEGRSTSTVTALQCKDAEGVNCPPSSYCAGASHPTRAAHDSRRRQLQGYHHKG
jgi:Thiamine pyrophosphate enzyme, C-terminal TPP binding domain